MADTDVTTGAPRDDAARGLLRQLVDSKAIDVTALAKVLAQAGPIALGDAVSRKGPTSVIRIYTNIFWFLKLRSDEGETVSDPAQLKAAVDRALGR